MRETRLVLVGLCLLAAAACTSAPGGIVWATGSGSQTQDGLQRASTTLAQAMARQPSADAGAQGRSSGDGDVVDAEFEDVDERKAS